MAKPKKADVVSAGDRVISAPNPFQGRDWVQTPGTYLAGRSYIDEADALAAEMEAKWGVGRLRLLVPPEMREKFDRQRYLFNQAIWHGNSLEDVKTQSARMCRAWYALDAKAEELGKWPGDPSVWEVALEDGSVAAICKDGYDASRINMAGRGMTIYTLEEISRLLSLYPAIAKIKNAIPGATVEAVRKTVSDPLDAFDDSSRPIDAPLVDDDIPW